MQIVIGMVGGDQHVQVSLIAASGCNDSNFRAFADEGQCVTNAGDLLEQLQACSPCG